MATISKGKMTMGTLHPGMKLEPPKKKSNWYSNYMKDIMKQKKTDEDIRKEHMETLRKNMPKLSKDNYLRI